MYEKKQMEEMNNNFKSQMGDIHSKKKWMYLSTFPEKPFFLVEN